jgi:thiosulfate/3-mercaptopyruvate sulfurtransferase
LTPLVSPEWLEARLGSVVVVDCRWSLTDPDAGRRAWEEGHVPGAAHLDVGRDLSGPPGDGRHPLPSPAFIERAGIGPGTVVAYDEGNGGAARLWWLLRHFGHPDPRVLEGGWATWRGPVSTDTAVATASSRFVPVERDDDIVTAEQILANPGFDLVDARAPGRYRGEEEPIDPVAGHIPGARNVPFTQPLSEIAAALGPDSVAYCGSGVTASVLVLAAASAGRSIRLYPGSWSQWCGRGLPVERGDPS